MTVKAPDGRDLRDVFRERFGYELVDGVEDVERIAGAAIRLDNAITRSGFACGKTTMNDRDFALLVFFAGVGRLAVLEENQLICAVENGELVALPPKG